MGTLLLAAGGGCSDEQASDSAGGEDQAEVGADLGSQVRTLFELHCASCHHDRSNSSGRQFMVLDFQFLRTASGHRFIDLSAPERSPIYTRLGAKVAPMPRSPARALTEGQKALVLSWLQQGAPDPSQPASALSQESVGSFATIQPTLAQKCADCHDSSQSGPWYSGLPGVSSDIANGRASFDFGNGFPFNGSDSPARVIGDVVLLKQTIEANTMPPSTYTAVHWSSRLSDGEKTMIKQWTDDVVSQLSPLVPATLR
jgi:hypothetical protein